MDTTSDGAAIPETCLADAVEDAYRLLHYAASTGRDITPAVRDPIIALRAALVGGAPTAAADEGAFLDAYARLAILAAPVTAVTLSATSPLHARRGRWSRLLRLGPVSRAQTLASLFGLVALALLVAIGAGEWTRTFIETVAVTQKQFAAASGQWRATEGTLSAVNAQIKSLTRPGAQGEPAANIDLLVRQRDEVEQRVRQLIEENGQLAEKITGSYDTLHQVFFFVRRKELENVIAPLGFILGGFLLPVLYGALGTCAYILRSLYGQMIDRSFDPRRSGEFVVRIFLGMVSGITLQWVIGKDAQGVPGGVTPAVLAFLGGYSVELLFSGMDRLLGLVTGKRAPSRQAARAVRPSTASAHAAGAAPAAR